MYICVCVFCMCVREIELYVSLCVSVLRGFFDLFGAENGGVVAEADAIKEATELVRRTSVGVCLLLLPLIVTRGHSRALELEVVPLVL